MLRSVPMPMVDIRPVHMSVDEFLVNVEMLMGALRFPFVVGVQVVLVVDVRVVVGERFMLVEMDMLLPEEQKQPGEHQPRRQPESP